MKAKLFLIILSCFIFLLSCNKSQNNSSEAGAATTTDAVANPLETEQNIQQRIPLIPFQGEQDSTASPQPAAKNSNTDWDKKIIKTADLKIQVKDFKEFNKIVHEKVNQSGGYVAKEDQSTAQDRLETSIVIKVPVDQFTELVNGLPDNAEKLIERKINTNDVTGEVFDIRSRLETKKQTRIKYLEFLRQSKNMEEVLQVQKEINDLQEQIEAAAGRINFLLHQSSFSTINLTYFQPLESYRPIDEEPSFSRRLKFAFNSGTTWFGNLLIGLMAIWPLIIIIIIGLMFLKRWKPQKS